MQQADAAHVTLIGVRRYDFLFVEQADGLAGADVAL